VEARLKITILFSVLLIDGYGVCPQSAGSGGSHEGNKRREETPYDELAGVAHSRAAEGRLALSDFSGTNLERSTITTE
jgi:hypothetical protein